VADSPPDRRARTDRSRRSWHSPLGPASFRSAARLYLGGANATHPIASPVYADLAGLPPMLILAGDHEVLLDDARRLADSARRAGVEVQLVVQDHMWHCWPAWAPELPEAVQAIEALADFLRRRLGGSGRP
jgi:monoterpene epsilon-lactone hydrolase